MNAALAIVLSKVWLQRTGRATCPESLEDIVSLKNIPSSFIDGLERCQWPGRGQKINLENHSLTIHLDGAHTPESMEACRKWFFDRSTTSSESLKVFVFNCNTSREPSTLLKAMAQCHFDLIIFTTNELGKSHILEDKRPNKEKQSAALEWQHKNHQTWLSLSDQHNCKIAASIPEVLNLLYLFEKGNPTKHVDVLCTGSLYLVGGWLEILKPEMCDNDVC